MEVGEIGGSGLGRRGRFTAKKWARFTALGRIAMNRRVRLHRLHQVGGCSPRV